MTTDWFEELTGFRENTYEDTKSKLAAEGGRLVSRVNGRSWAIGEFRMVSLSDLRTQAAGSSLRKGRLRFRLVKGDVHRLHADPAYAGALFQVVSQFNALEMTGPEVSPEDGATRYADDHTQGPACALAAAPATIYRNYFAPVDEGFGQSLSCQLDGLAEVGRLLANALSRPVRDLWTMQNGYALCSASGLTEISNWLTKSDPAAVDVLRGALAIGLHDNIEVTAPGARRGVLVSQAFCSALPVAYSRIPQREWRDFATLILEAAYEATFLASAIRAARDHSNVLALTLLGGGAFGNKREWIFAAIRHAAERVRGLDLDIRVVSYAEPDPALVGFIEGL